MRPRSSVKLVLTSTLPLALTACSQPDDSVSFLVKKNFSTHSECTAAKIPDAICSAASTQATNEHFRVAPRYDDQASCDADFAEGYCEIDYRRKYMPKIGGFELAVSGTLPIAEYDKILIQRSRSRMARENNANTEPTLSHVLSAGSNLQYFGQPLYPTCSHRNTSPKSPSLQNSSSRSGITRFSLSPTISRGGFGQHTSARSGWSGRSSSGFSYGG